MAKRKFDLEAEARQLYREAKARGDFTGAASALRLLKDLSKDQGERRPSTDDEEQLSPQEIAERAQQVADILREKADRVAELRSMLRREGK